MQIEGDVQRYLGGLTFWIVGVIGLFAGCFVPAAYGLAESTGSDGSNAQAVHTLGETGEGINVGFISGRNIRTTHEAFYDKDPNGNPIGTTHAFNYDYSGAGTSSSSHDTSVAGIVAGRGGFSYPNDIGAAPGVDIHSARVADNNNMVSSNWMILALDQLIDTQQCQVIVTAISLPGIDPDGQDYFSRIYDYYAYWDNAVFATAAGNQNTHITVFGDTFNSITTGGLEVTDPDIYAEVGRVSGSGPTQDGRRKPDLTAPAESQWVPRAGGNTAWDNVGSSDGQTSYSVPHTAGVAALLLGLADDTAEENDNRNEVIKAVIVNSTFPNINDKDGNWTDPADPNRTWHADRGYGRIDGLRAYQLLNTPPVVEGDDITQNKGWAYATMANKKEVDFYYIAGEKNQRLVLTVTWNRRVNENGGLYTEETAPKFNLDLTIRDLTASDPNEQILFAETDTIDNLVKVDLLLPNDGLYEISLENTDTKNNRSYAVAFELREPMTGDFYPADNIVDHADLATVAQQWLATDSNLEADLTGQDNTVNMRDLAEFANHLFEIDPAYYGP